MLAFAQSVFLTACPSQAAAQNFRKRVKQSPRTLRRNPIAIAAITVGAQNVRPKTYSSFQWRRPKALPIQVVQAPWCHKIEMEHKADPTWPHELSCYRLTPRGACGFQCIDANTSRLSQAQGITKIRLMASAATCGSEFQILFVFLCPTMPKGDVCT